MNVRLQYDLDFLAGIYYDERLQLNSYSISMSLLTKTTDAANTNIAMDRLKMFMHGELANTVFVNQALKERAEMLQIMGVNVTTLPEEPVDQIVGMMLYYKLNAIMEGRMAVTRLDLMSALGDSVWYQHDADEDSPGPFRAEGWWHESTVQHDTVAQGDTGDNVVKVVPNAWIEYGLTWPEDTPEPTANTVVFANFTKNED
jgi:hypothetical protein